MKVILYFQNLALSCPAGGHGRGERLGLWDGRRCGEPAGASAHINC